MIAALGAIAPIFAIILIGWWLRRQPWLPEPFWLGAERLVFWVLFPSLLLLSVGVADAGALPLGGIAVALVGSLLAMTGVAIGVSRAARLPSPRLTSVAQGCIRPNIYIGFAAVATLWHAPGVALYSLAVAIGIPLVNLIAVVLLTSYGTARPTWSGTLRQIAVNPIILGCLGGIVLSLSPAKLPGPVTDMLKFLGQASLPLALLSIGASLDFSLLRSARGPLVAACLGKLAVLPALTWGLGRLMGLDPLIVAVLALFNAMPASPSSYVMARQMGGDHMLMAAILTCQTVLAAATLPILLTAVSP